MFASRITSWAALALTAALLATAAPAGARPAPDPSFTPTHPRVKPARVIEVAPAAAFDWGDAAIGAGATLGLVLAITGGGVALTRRRTRHPTARPVAS